MSAKKSKKAVMPFSGFATLQNPSKTLLANIKFSSLDAAIRTISITSTLPDEGKTTTAVALAIAIATSGSRVLLVEADMRRRSVARVLGAKVRGGSYAVLSGSAQLFDVVWPTQTPNLFFLDVEPNIPNPADILSSRRYAEFVTQVRAEFDYVIFDTPPVGVFIDAAILGTLVDTTILCVRKGQTKREQAVAAVKQLRQMKCPVLGTVLTFAESESSDYDYYNYYHEPEKRANHTGARR